jgi:hypothetical protein
MQAEGAPMKPQTITFPARIYGKRAMLERQRVRLAGEKIEDVERMIANDPEALADFQKETTKKVGAPIGNDNAAKPENRKTNNSNTTNYSKVNRGKAYTLSRLKRETPELFAAVVKVELMTRADIATIAFALAVLQSPRHRQSLIRMALGAPLPPTRWRATWTRGDGTGQGKELTMPPALIIIGSVWEAGSVVVPRRTVKIGAGSFRFPVMHTKKVSRTYEICRNR